MFKAVRCFFLFFMIPHKSLENTTVTYNDLVEQTMTVLQSCMTPQTTDPLVLAGESSEFLHKTVFDGIPVALISKTHSSAFDFFALTKYSFDAFENFNFPWMLRKSHRLVVIASSQPFLRLLLHKIKDSCWANADGFYVLIDKETKEHGCKNSYRYLWTAWEYDLMSVVFFCIDPIDGLVFYSFSPYNDDIPRIWEQVRTFKGRNGHPWLLIKRKHRTDSRLCEDIDFVKTNNLYGYEVRLNAIAMEPLLKVNLSAEGMDKFTGDNGETMKILFSKLNASLYVTVHNGTAYDLGGIGKGGTMVGMMADVSEGKVDMGMNARPFYMMWKIRYTYPHAEGGYCVITQPAGQVSEIVKLLSFVSTEIIIGIAIICIITHLVLSKDQGFVPAALNLIRLMISVSMVRPPRMNSSRIFICTVIMLFIIVNAIFQGHWAALLTVPMSYPNINTLDDLKKSGFDLYGAKFMEDAIADRELESRFHSVSYDECKEHVRKSNRAACVGDCLHLFQRIRRENLHHSKKIRELVQVYVARENWPLFGRVNGIIQAMVEAGLVRMWRKQSARPIFRERRIRRVMNTGFKVLKLKRLTFSFYILGIGYTCATIAFLVELAIGRRRNRLIKY